jgi:hypothetical protein
MLQRIPFLSSTAGEVQTISGQELGRRVRRLDPTGKALLADELKGGAVQVFGLTDRQARALTGAKFGYTNAVAHLTERERAHVRAGTLSLASKQRQRRQPESLTEHLMRASRDERREAARVVGPAAIWDDMVAPLV